MSAKIYALGLVSVLALASGCTTYVTESRYNKDLGLLKDYNSTLEGRNAELEKYKAAYEKLKGRTDITLDANRAYDEMAASLKRALSGIGFAEGDFTYDPKTGAFIFKSDVLFSLGSFQVSARGKAALAQFARANRGKTLKIVGHTDRKPIARVSTGKNNPITKTNLELSSNRAIAVAGVLMANGISERSIFTESRGSTQPRGTFAQSRRVEIFIAK